MRKAGFSDVPDAAVPAAVLSDRLVVLHAGAQVRWLRLPRRPTRAPRRSTASTTAPTSMPARWRCRRSWRRRSMPEPSSAARIERPWRLYRTHALLLAVTAVAMAWLFHVTRLDLQLAAPYYDAVNHTFPWRYAWVSKYFIHRYVKYALLLCRPRRPGSLAAWYELRPHARRVSLPSHRRRLWFVALSFRAGADRDRAAAALQRDALPVGQSSISAATRRTSTCFRRCPPACAPVAVSRPASSHRDPGCWRSRCCGIRNAGGAACVVGVAALAVALRAGLGAADARRAFPVAHAVVAVDQLGGGPAAVHALQRCVA